MSDGRSRGARAHARAEGVGHEHDLSGEPSYAAAIANDRGRLSLVMEAHRARCILLDAVETRVHPVFDLRDLIRASHEQHGFGDCGVFAAT